MIPAVITNTSILFFARGQAWTLAADHPKFGEVKALLATGTDDADSVVRLADVRVAVEMATEGQAVLTEDYLLLNGKKMSSDWREKASSAPDSLRVLLVYPGDKVRVEGDEDCKDGIYEVGEIDDGDINKRIMVTSDEDFFGYVANSSIKEIVERVERPPVVDQAPEEPSPAVEGCGCAVHDTCDNCGEEMHCGESGECDECIQSDEDED